VDEGCSDGDPDRGGVKGAAGGVLARGGDAVGAAGDDVPGEGEGVVAAGDRGDDASDGLVVDVELYVGERCGAGMGRGMGERGDLDEAKVLEVDDVRAGGCAGAGIVAAVEGDAVGGAGDSQEFDAAAVACGAASVVV